MGAQRVTNTLTFTSCPTITISNKKTTKRRHLRPLNRKRRNSYITSSNCRTACLGWGGRTQFDSFLLHSIMYGHHSVILETSSLLYLCEIEKSAFRNQFNLNCNHF